MSRTAITDLAERALTVLKGLTLQGSPHYSAALSTFPLESRIPIAFTLADRSFPFHLSTADTHTAYTVYHSMALCLPNTTPGLRPPTSLTELKPSKE